MNLVTRRLGALNRKGPRLRALEAFGLRRAGLTYREIGIAVGAAASDRPITAESARVLVFRGERIARKESFRLEVMNPMRLARVRSRPLDMGGPRGVWITSTPESVARELGLA